jgi:5S rRNA maturation endonuclease (ribonuclease M5)
MVATDFIKDNLTKDKIVDILVSNGASHVNYFSDSMHCTCPIHKGDNPTGFTWNFSNNLWYCHTGDCGGGDIFDLIASLYEYEHGVEFVQIVQKTAEILGISIEGLDIIEIDTDRRRETKEWLQYISKKNMKEIINKEYDLRKLGSLYKINNYRNIPSYVLHEFGVCYAKDMNRICFTIKDMENKIIGASLRRIEESDKGKWIHRPKSIRTGETLYNIDRCIQNGFREVYIVEGIIDVLVLYSLGVCNVIATFGANLTIEQLLIIVSHFDFVHLMYDNDKKGILANIKAINMLKNVMNIDVIVPTGKDAGELTSIDEFNSFTKYKYYEYEPYIKSLEGEKNGK